MVVNCETNTSPSIFSEKEKCLISTKAKKKLDSVLTDIFPRRFLTYVFELRTNNKSKQVDLAIGIKQDDDLIFFENHFENKSKKITKLLTQYKQLNSDILKWNAIWLEMDFDDTYSPTQTPSVFVNLKPQDQTYLQIKTHAELLNFTGVNQINYNTLLRCINNLSETQYVEHIGVMHSRINNKTIRLYIRGFDRISLAKYLKKINWPRFPGDVTKLLNVFKNIPFYLSVSIEFDDELKATLGIEFHFGSDILNAQLFLDKLEAENYIAESKSASFKEIIEPKKISYDNCLYTRSLSHFKLNIKENGTIEPKVYMQLTPNLLGAFGF